MGVMKSNGSHFSMGITPPPPPPFLSLTEFDLVLSRFCLFQTTVPGALLVMKRGFLLTSFLCLGLKNIKKEVHIL